MKKSNKLLLAGFLAVVYANYKAGRYTLYNADNDQPVLPMRTFPNILFVTMRNVSGASVKFGDTAAVSQSEGDQIQYARKGDTLLITGSNNTRQEDFGHRVVLNLPYQATLSLISSSASMEAGKNTAESNPVIYLKNSRMAFSGAGAPLRFGRVKIVASDSSRATFGNQTQIGSLEAQVFDSALEYGEGDVGQLSIVTDSLSHLSLSSKLLLKANIKTISPE
jgi:hypothetical protein